MVSRSELEELQRYNQTMEKLSDADRKHGRVTRTDQRVRSERRTSLSEKRTRQEEEESTRRNRILARVRQRRRRELERGNGNDGVRVPSQQADAHSNTQRQTSEAVLPSPAPPLVAATSQPTASTSQPTTNGPDSRNDGQAASSTIVERPSLCVHGTAMQPAHASAPDSSSPRLSCLTSVLPTPSSSEMAQLAPPPFVSPASTQRSERPPPSASYVSHQPPELRSPPLAAASIPSPIQGVPVPTSWPLLMGAVQPAEGNANSHVGSACPAVDAPTPSLVSTGASCPPSTSEGVAHQAAPSSQPMPSVASMPTELSQPSPLGVVLPPPSSQAMPSVALKLTEQSQPSPPDDSMHNLDHEGPSTLAGSQQAVPAATAHWASIESPKRAVLEPMFRELDVAGQESASSCAHRIAPRVSAPPGRINIDITERESAPTPRELTLKQKADSLHRKMWLICKKMANHGFVVWLSNPFYNEDCLKSCYYGSPLVAEPPKPTGRCDVIVTLLVTADEDYIIVISQGSPENEATQMDVSTCLALHTCRRWKTISIGLRDRDPTGGRSCKEAYNIRNLQFHTLGRFDGNNLPGMPQNRKFFHLQANSRSTKHLLDTFREFMRQSAFASFAHYQWLVSHSFMDLFSKTGGKIFTWKA